MTLLADIAREARHLARRRLSLVWLVVTVAIAALSVRGGLQEVDAQRATISELILLDRAEREAVRAQQSDWGGLAYASYHFVYEEPSAFAFAALGQREREPWKHRVRALALEGQIYERDAGNPVLAIVGNFDFAFFGSMVVPLLLIVLLHDLRSHEQESRRLSLLVASSGDASSPFALRAALISIAVFLASAVPLIVAGIMSGASGLTLWLAVMALLIYVGMWAVLCYQFSKRDQNSPTLLGQLLGVWVMLAIVLPSISRPIIENSVSIPSGADIQMTQREAVNDAWDLPKEATMEAFVGRHPEWASYTAVERPFEWKWYFAFQQVGDQAAESLSTAYAEGRMHRDQLGWVLSLFSPPALFERVYQLLANTDVRAQLAYEARVRAYHSRLRHFYYPKLFLNEPFDPGLLDQTPSYPSRSGE